MSATNYVHPSSPPSPPYWRGCSDLTGEYGDLLYGSYARSTNAYVKTGTAVAKRRGYERAIDELFWGSADVHAHRDGATKLLLVADLEGIKVVDAVPPSTHTGYSIEHPGFVDDDFTRADAAGLITNTTNIHWIEGQDSEETGGPTGADTFQVVSNDCNHDSSNAVTAEADWTIQAPTPFYALLCELDFTNLTLAAGEEADFQLYLGLPPKYLVDPQSPTPTTGRERQWACDARDTWTKTINSQGGSTWGTCWTGLVMRIRLKRETGGTNPYILTGNLTEFGSDQPQKSRLARKGGLASGANVPQMTFQSLSSAQALGSWVVEFGRRSLGSAWQLRSTIWRDQTIDDVLVPGGPTTTNFRERRSENIEVDAQFGGRYINLPLGGKGGHFGMSSLLPSASAGDYDIVRIRPSLSFVNP